MKVGGLIRRHFLTPCNNGGGCCKPRQNKIINQVDLIFFQWDYAIISGDKRAEAHHEFIGCGAFEICRNCDPSYERRKNHITKIENSSDTLRHVRIGEHILRVSIGMDDLMA